MICVAASDAAGALSPTSNRGRDSVDVAAPGRTTSFAAPWVAARAATLLWRHPGWSTRELRAATVARGDRGAVDRVSRP